MKAENGSKDTKQVNNFPHRKDKLPLNKACGERGQECSRTKPKKKGGFNPPPKMIKFHNLASLSYLCKSLQSAHPIKDTVQGI